MRRYAFVAIAVSLVVAGCGGDDDDSAGSTAPAPDTAGATEAVDDAGAADATEASSTEADSTEADSTEEPSTEAAGDTDGSIDPCALVTADEAAAVLGAEPAEPTNVDAGAVGACTYRLPDGSGAVQVNVEQGDGEQFMTELSGASGASVEVVEGVGDGAVVSETLGQITVVQDDVRFAIFVSPVGGGPVDAATLTGLAEVAVGRL